MKMTSSKLGTGLAALVAAAGLAGVLAATPAAAHDRDGRWGRDGDRGRHHQVHPNFHQHRHAPPYGSVWGYRGQRQFGGYGYYAPSYYGPPVVIQPAPVIERYYRPGRGWIEVTFGGPL